MKNLKGSQYLIAIINEAQKIGRYIWEKGWAERNGGNFSILLTDKLKDFELLKDKKYFKKLEGLPKESANHKFFVTGKGQRLRDLDEPEKVSAIIEINNDATGYYVLWGGCISGFEITSEFHTHLGILLDKYNLGMEDRAVVHTHPVELIAISHHPVYGKNPELLRRKLWKMLPEVRGFVPRGVDLIPYIITGSKELAETTIKSVRKYDVALWEKHGALATGKNLTEAFDFIDVANKGAAILLTCLSAGFDPVGMTENELKELEDTFNL